MGVGPVQYRYVDTITLKASGAQTVSTVGATTAANEHAAARLTLAVTASSGTTPTLDVVVETSADGTTWRSLGAFAQKTGVASERKSFAGCDSFIRYNATVGGTTPSFTYSVIGSAV